MVKYIITPDRANHVTEFQGEVSLGNVNITGGTITGITDLAIADGGTGASTASAARTNLDAQEDLSGATLTGVTVAATDKVLIQDISDSDNLKTVTAQSIADLGGFTSEAVQDIVGAMVTGNTETLISVTYEDSDGTLDFVVNEAGINHDNLTGFVANEHIDWTAASNNFLTTGTATIGTTETFTLGGAGATPTVSIDLDGRVFTFLTSHNDTSAGASSTLDFLRSRGTTASRTIINSGDSLGKFFALGWDGSTYQNAAGIEFKSAGTPGAGDMPGQILFQTTPDGSATLATAMTINSDQNIDVAAGLDITGNLTLTGSITSATAETVATDDKVLIKDTSASDVIRTVTTQSIANLYTTAATTSASGIAELATNAETLTGTDTTRIVTPDDLSYARPLAYVQAYRSSNQTISDSTFTLVQLDTIALDNLSDFDNVTNYRWTPTIAGVYYVLGGIRYASGSTGLYRVNIFQNGAVVLATVANLSSTSVVANTASGFLSFNGTTDYVDLRAYQVSGGNLDVVGAAAFHTFLQGYLVART